VAAPAVKPSVPPPMAGLGVPGIPGADVAPPPFMQKAKAEPPKPKRPADPFAAGAPAAQAGPQEVRLVIDEKAMPDSESGRRGRGTVIIVAAVGIVLGLIAGYGVGSVVAENKTYNATVRDGKDIYQIVQGSSTKVNQATTIVNTLVTKARGGPGKRPAVDYAAIEQLRAIEKPLSANDFSRKRYGAFAPPTVDALFEYYNTIQVVWDKFTSLANTTLPAARRTELDAAAGAASEIATRQVGLVPFTVGDNIAGGLVIVDMPANRNQDEPLPEKLMVRSRPGGPPAERTRYTGQPLTENPENYVLLVETARSIGVLGQQAGPFAEYQRDIMAIKQLMDKLVEVQGRLETELGNIAHLEETFAF
jgi:hypothetical protein